MKTQPTILVSGMVAAHPWQGGATWAVLQYLLGFRQLGCQVYFVEPIPPKTIKPGGTRLADSDNANYFRQVMQEFGLENQSSLLLDGTKETVGLPYNQLETIARRSDALLNISGLLTDTALCSPPPVRVYLDLDPAFNQLWRAAQGLDMRFDGHTHFVTIGQSIGEAGCPVPTCGLTWLKTFQPVVLDRWPFVAENGDGAFTTIGHWRAYGSIEHEGRLYGQKAHSLRQFFSLPGLTEETLSLALAIHPDESPDLVALADNGWELVDPAKVAQTPAAYQQFIQRSKAELGIAKSGYVVSQCGWFSDRSICYLASGRPVIAQETGFSRYLPTGDGLFAFNNQADVLNAIEDLNGDYHKHATSARALAENIFDSGKVLPRLLEQVGV